MSCVGLLQCTLKVLNFLLTLVGAGVILYSLWALNQWYVHLPPNSIAPAPAAFGPTTVTISDFSSMPLGMAIPFQEKAVEQVGPDSDEALLELPLASSEQPQDVKQETTFVFGRPLFVMANANKLSFSLFPKNLPAPW